MAKRLGICAEDAGFETVRIDTQFTDDQPESHAVIICAWNHLREFESDQLEALVTDHRFILITDGRPNPFADRLMRRGATFHLREPVDFDYLQTILLDFKREQQRSQSGRLVDPMTSSLDQFGLLLGTSSVMRRLYRLIRRVSRTDANVFLVGESGTGKELAARTIHQQSPRAGEPFIAVNCAALTPELVGSELFGHVKGAFTGAIESHEGFFQQGGKGTLLLDEVTEMPMTLQSKLLRVLESGEFSPLGSERVLKTGVRVLAASNREPMEAVEEGRLREDLYYRLAHVSIHLPPLRERRGDVRALALHFLAHRNQATNTRKQITEQALKRLDGYAWPGNVRELKHTVERAHILAVDLVGVGELPALGVEQRAREEEQSTIGPGMTLREAERNLIFKTLDYCDHNKTATAAELGISVKTLYNKLRRYDKEP